MNNLEVMIDLETLGIENNAVISSIGIAIFNKDKIVDTYYAVLNKQQQIQKNRVINANTLSWWMTQNSEACKAMFKDEQSVSIALLEISNKLDKLVQNGNTLFFWGNGPTFDITLLESLYKDFNIKSPINFRQINCFRTVKRFLGNGITVPDSEMAHNALEDAIWQAQFLQKILQKKDKV